MWIGRAFLVGRVRWDHGKPSGMCGRYRPDDNEVRLGVAINAGTHVKSVMRAVFGL